MNIDINIVTLYYYRNTLITEYSKIVICLFFRPMKQMIPGIKTIKYNI